MSEVETSRDAAVVAEILASNPDGISSVGLLGWAQLRIGSEFDDSRLQAALAALGSAVTVDGSFVRPAQALPVTRSPTPAPSRQPPSEWAAASPTAIPSALAGPPATKTYWTLPPTPAPAPALAGTAPRTVFRDWVLSRWVLAGVALGLLLPVVVMLSDLCGAGEAVFGITLMGAIFGAIGGFGLRPSSHDKDYLPSPSLQPRLNFLTRVGQFLLGTSFGFAAAFVFIFILAAQFMAC